MAYRHTFARRSQVHSRAPRNSVCVAHKQLASVEVTQPVFITGLPRAGTTLLLELCANTGLYINKAEWAKLPTSYQTMLRAACTYALVEMLAGYDARNAKALARVVAAGAQLVVLTPETLRVLRNALEQVLDEEAAKSEQFKKVLENWRVFRAEQHRWFSIADARTEMSVYALTATTQ